MSDYAVIVQNDESKWDDIKGELYHYPNIYRSILRSGCKAIYYKGRMTNPAFAANRLSPEAHYFGIGVIGESIIDSDSPRKDRYCEILDYQEFQEAVPIKEGKEYLEPIPASKKSNYWRFGVRVVPAVCDAAVLSTRGSDCPVVGYGLQGDRVGRLFRVYDLASTVECVLSVGRLSGQTGFSEFEKSGDRTSAEVARADDSD